MCNVHKHLTNKESSKLYGVPVKIHKISNIGKLGNILQVIKVVGVDLCIFQESIKVNDSFLN